LDLLEIDSFNARSSLPPLFVLFPFSHLGFWTQNTSWFHFLRVLIIFACPFPRDFLSLQ
jgi:hypothetical protein